MSDTPIALRPLRDKRQLPAGMTPRLLTADQAAAYCGVGRETFEARVGVSALRVFGARKLYDRHALDVWLDRESGIAEMQRDDGVDWAKALS